MAKDRFNPETPPDDVPLRYFALREIDRDRDANHDLADAILVAVGILLMVLAVLLVWAAVSFSLLRPAKADVLLVRDNGRYAGSPLKSWFDSLASGRGPCCSFADGFRIDDVDWDVQCATVAGQEQCGYRVRVGGRWIDVPPEAVVQGANRYGPAVVWPYEDPNGETQIRCFLPGAGA